MSPDDIANLQKAMAAHQAGNLAEAEAHYHAVLAAVPEQFEALHYLGILEAQRGNNAEAERLVSRSVTVNPGLPDAFFNHARILRSLGRQADVVAACDKALALKADYVEALVLRGNALRDLNRLDEALPCLEQAVAHQPGYPVGWAARGDILAALGRHADALASHDRALALNPDYPEGLSSRGIILLEMHRFDEALAAFDAALKLRPDFPQAINQRGRALRALKRFDDAIASFDQAIAAQPHFASAHFNRARTLLLTGHFEAGWPGYEYRYEVKGIPLQRPDLRAPVWQDEPLLGRSVVLYAEEGLGDTIHAVRYIPMLRRMGASVTLLAPAEWERLLRSAARDFEVTSRVSDRAFDFQLPAMSLPGRLGTRLANIPAPVPYLRGEAELVRRWRERIGEHGFRVGINWQGESLNQGESCSIPLRHFAALAGVPNVRLISLQPAGGVDQLTGLPEGIKVEALGDDFGAGADACVDAAAAMSSLDLVITCDSAIAHVAGALARPAWAALAHVPDWRWLLDRDDSPWYPQMRLYRQAQWDDWDGVFARMTTDLHRLAGGTTH